MTNTNNKETSRQMLLAYFKENEEVFNETIEDLDSWNGYLQDDRYYNMDELDQFIDTSDIWNSLIYRMYYGHDQDNYITDQSGNREYKEFNPNREYFYYNAYGNLISADYKDYTDHLDEYFIDDLIDNYSNLNTSDYLPDEINDILENLVNLENREDQ